MSDSKPLAGAEKTDAGVKVNGVIIQAVIDKCEGCERIRSFEGQSYCSSFPSPSGKWRMGSRCNMATHIQTQHTAAQKVNPLKASKRAAKGK